MPQITVYVSHELARAASLGADSLEQLHRALAQAETVNLQAIKSRMVVAPWQCVGDGKTAVQNLFIRCGVLPGRDMALREQMRDALMHEAMPILGERKGYALAVVVYEMPCYSKIERP